ncbi:kinase-like protein, partial [Cucurbitaria berberidis CBS 394.84]
KRYVSIRLLGEGGNGTVHLCRDTKVGTLVAVKTIYHDKPRSPPNEVQILHLLGYHQNIVRYYTMLSHPTQKFHKQLLFEYCPIGDLVDYVNSSEDGNTEMFIWHVFKHIAAGLDYMHQNGVVHGDIKPCNILLTAPRDGDIYPLPKIADFGTAQVNHPYNIPYGHRCTEGWQPPEAEFCHGPAADVWALGCIVHALALGRLPQKEIKPPAMDPETWFYLNGKEIPLGTEYSIYYKEFCFYMAFHPAAPMRINRPSSRTSTIYSRLLNYLMMRTLDTSPRDRISTHELHEMLLILEPFVHNLLVLGKEDLLDRFDDGRDGEWKQVRPITDSQVFRHIFCVVALQTDCESYVDMLSWDVHLLKLMDAGDHAAACQFV